MNRLLAGCLASLVIACGGQEAASPSGPSSGGGSTDDPTGRIAPVTSVRLTAAAKQAKVVLKTSSPVEVQVRDYDAATDEFVPQACQAAADCASLTAANPGVHCSSGFCAVTQIKTSIFYVRNSTVSDPAQFTFPVPCDGKEYAAEVFGSDGAKITDRKWAAAIAVATDCTPPATISWADSAAPSLTFPAVYVGLPAPYSTFKVGMQNLLYPWSTDYTITCGGALPTVKNSAGATFAAPTTAATLTCNASFTLDSSLFVTGESTAPWQLPVSGSTKPVAAANLGG